MHLSRVLLSVCTDPLFASIVCFQCWQVAQSSLDSVSIRRVRTIRIHMSHNNRKTNILLTGTPGVGKSTLVHQIYNDLCEALPTLSVGGFWTREVRVKGSRVGFDCILLSRHEETNANGASDGDGDGDAESACRWENVVRLASVRGEEEETTGARGERRSKKRSEGSDVKMGRYDVHVADFVQKVLPCVSVCEKKNANGVDRKSGAKAQGDGKQMTFVKELLVLDEIGKMELLCPGFEAAVLKRLADPLCVVFGTIPVKGLHNNLGEAVDAIREREDTVVVEVSLENRQRIRQEITDLLTEALTVVSPASCIFASTASLALDVKVEEDGANSRNENNKKKKKRQKRRPGRQDGDGNKHDLQEAIESKRQLAATYIRDGDKRFSFRSFCVDFTGNHGTYTVTKRMMTAEETQKQKQQNKHASATTSFSPAVDLGSVATSSSPASSVVPSSTSSSASPLQPNSLYVLTCTCPFFQRAARAAANETGTGAQREKTEEDGKEEEKQQGTPSSGGTCSHVMTLHALFIK